MVLCIDHRGLHAGGCNPTTKPHIKEECLVPVPCYKPIGELYLPGLKLTAGVRSLIFSPVLGSRFAPSGG